jgi:hypothetical protein
MKFLFHTTRAKNLILMNLYNMDMPLLPHGGHTQNTVFSLATEVGQEVQHQGRTTRWKVVALIGRGLPPEASPAVASMEASREALKGIGRRYARTPKSEEVPCSQRLCRCRNWHPPAPCCYGGLAERRALDHCCVFVKKHDRLEDKATTSITRTSPAAMASEREENMPLSLPTRAGLIRGEETPLPLHCCRQYMEAEEG